MTKDTPMDIDEYVRVFLAPQWAELEAHAKADRLNWIRGALTDLIGQEATNSMTEGQLLMEANELEKSLFPEGRRFYEGPMNGWSEYTP